MLLANRREAGRELARHLTAYRGKPDTIVLALPRGGVPVGFEVARALDAPLDVYLVRKLGVPGHPELAMGAVASGGVRVMNPDVVTELNIPADEIDAATAAQQTELNRQERRYRKDHPPLDVKNRIVILVDDGLATGATMRAAVKALRRQNVARIVVAVPVGAAGTCSELKPIADEVICPQTPDPFYAVGQWYTDFSQTSDAEVETLLADALAPAASVSVVE